ncbi:unnamed protein product, partial [marine sediment metagenome]
KLLYQEKNPRSPGGENRREREEQVLNKCG